ncbi:unnamed protein product [Urochloa humidicola]
MARGEGTARASSMVAAALAPLPPRGREPAEEIPCRWSSTASSSTSIQMGKLSAPPWSCGGRRRRPASPRAPELEPAPPAAGATVKVELDLKLGGALRRAPPDPAQGSIRVALSLSPDPRGRKGGLPARPGRAGRHDARPGPALSGLVGTRRPGRTAGHAGKGDAVPCFSSTRTEPAGGAELDGRAALRPAGRRRRDSGHPVEEGVLEKERRRAERVGAPAERGRAAALGRRMREAMASARGVRRRGGAGRNGKTRERKKEKGRERRRGPRGERGVVR